MPPRTGDIVMTRKPHSYGISALPDMDRIDARSWAHAYALALRLAARSGVFAWYREGGRCVPLDAATPPDVAPTEPRTAAVEGL
jgi:hypothetical protein